MAHTLEVKDTYVESQDGPIIQKTGNTIPDTDYDRLWNPTSTTTGTILIVIAIIVTIAIIIGIMYFALEYAYKQRNENRKSNRIPDYNVWYAWIVILLAYICLFKLR